MRLKDKTVLVTGAGAGIGKAIAETFGLEGAKVALSDKNRDTGEAVAEGIRQRGGSAIFIEGNTSKEADAQRMVRLAVENFGRLDILVNNAGIELIKPTHELTEQDWDSVMNVNLKGYFFVSKHAVVQMLTQGKGNIINIASLAGLVGFPLLAAYAASKGGVVQLTRTMALEYRDANIRVNAICPGLVKTDLGDRFLEAYNAAGFPIEMVLQMLQGRTGTVEEVAAAALFLAGDGARIINGVVLPLDGGAYAG